jgi:lysophosphatidylcholine acyltransferase/lyso-PAF acetyltransferase
MESELQNISLEPPKQQSDPINDDRPLLKPVTIFASDTEELEKKFAPYVRHDVYGTMGRSELPTKEKFLLGVALVTLVPVRVVVAMTILLLYYLICRVCTFWSVPNREDEQEDYAHMVGWRRIVIVQCGKALSRLMLFILGFYWIRQSRRSENPTSNEVFLF